MGNQQQTSAEIEDRIRIQLVYRLSGKIKQFNKKPKLLDQLYWHSAPLTRMLQSFFMQTLAHCNSATVHCSISWELCYNMHPNNTEELSVEILSQQPIVESLFTTEITELSGEQMQTRAASQDELAQEKQDTVLVRCWRYSLPNIRKHNSASAGKCEGHPEWF